MKCPNCDKKLTNKRINEVLVKRKNHPRAHNSHKIYCDNKCFTEYRAANKKRLTTCPECGQPKNRTSMRCQLCREIAVSEKWLDSEVKELVVLNPGAGFDYFIDTVIQPKNGRFWFRQKLTYFLNDLKEIEGIDYVAWLQNPDAMRLVSQDKIPAGFERYSLGSRRSGTAAVVKRRRMREGLPTRDNGNRVMIKIPREFRWGKYEPR